MVDGVTKCLTACFNSAAKTEDRSLRIKAVDTCYQECVGGTKLENMSKRSWDFMGCLIKLSANDTARALRDSSYKRGARRCMRKLGRVKMSEAAMNFQKLLRKQPIVPGGAICIAGARQALVQDSKDVLKGHFIECVSSNRSKGIDFLRACYNVFVKER